jgi:hypothetical protein
MYYLSKNLKDEYVQEQREVRDNIQPMHHELQIEDHNGNDIEVQDQTMAAFTGLEANIAQKPLIINNATIASLGEMYPHNDGVSNLQASLTETINSGRKIEDMPEEIKDQLKLIFNPK